MGMRLAVDKFKGFAIEQLDLAAKNNCLEAAFADEIKQAAVANDPSQVEIEKQRQRVAKLKDICSQKKCPQCEQLLSVADYLVRKSVWALGGDGWAYDIGYGGLDHVLASGKNVNILVLDTEVYSNTGGQMSKSTPRAAVAQFAAAGKSLAKKDLAMLAMTYGSIYVAKVALGANMAQTVKAFVEAENYNGPSLIIAYSHCIAHGYNLLNGYEHQKQAVASGYWPLYRFNPDLKAQGQNPLQLDSKAPTADFTEYAYSENRYRTLKNAKPQIAAELMNQAKQDVIERFNLVQQLAALQCGQCKKSE
ncbi:MAG: Pyruvate-flavodoxin oxidoreductase [Planctomycetes bacterium ADurb.Bin401]|nr:MAG: Pyruvate-flavodoxin oxidoreductase [Planctomycetes bacterium ADurb.Bin401]